MMVVGRTRLAFGLACLCVVAIVFLTSSGQESTIFESTEADFNADKSMSSILKNLGVNAAKVKKEDQQERAEDEAYENAQSPYSLPIPKAKAPPPPPPPQRDFTDPEAVVEDEDWLDKEQDEDSHPKKNSMWAKLQTQDSQEHIAKDAKRLTLLPDHNVDKVKEWLKDNTERKGKLTGTPYPGSKEAKVAAKAKKETKTPQANKASAIPVSSATVANTLETSSADLVGKVKAVISTKAADPTSVVPEMSTDAPENHPLQSLKEARKHTSIAIARSKTQAAVTVQTAETQQSMKEAKKEKKPEKPKLTVAQAQKSISQSVAKEASNLPQQFVVKPPPLPEGPPLQYDPMAAQKKMREKLSKEEAAKAAAKAAAKKSAPVYSKSDINYLTHASDDMTFKPEPSKEAYDVGAYDPKQDSEDDVTELKPNERGASLSTLEKMMKDPSKAAEVANSDDQDGESINDFMANEAHALKKAGQKTRSVHHVLKKEAQEEGAVAKVETVDVSKEKELNSRGDYVAPAKGTTTETAEPASKIRPESALAKSGMHDPLAKQIAASSALRNVVAAGNAAKDPNESAKTVQGLMDRFGASSNDDDGYY